MGDSISFLDSLLGGGRTYKLVPMPSSSSSMPDVDGNAKGSSSSNNNNIQGPNQNFIQNNDHMEAERESMLYSSTPSKLLHRHYNSKDKETHDQYQFKRNLIKVVVIFLLVLVGYHLSDPEKVSHLSLIHSFCTTYFHFMFILFTLLPLWCAWLHIIRT